RSDFGALPLPSWGEGWGEGVTEPSRDLNPSPRPSPYGRGSTPSLSLALNSISTKSSLRRVEPFGIELVQKREVLIRRRLGHPQMGRELQGKSGVVLKLFPTHARIERHHLHAPLVGFESEHRQIGDHAERAAGEQAARAPRVAAAQIAGAGDEIDVL